jgi:hypothetical protein
MKSNLSEQPHAKTTVSAKTRHPLFPTGVPQDPPPRTGPINRQSIGGISTRRLHRADAKLFDDVDDDKK